MDAFEKITNQGQGTRTMPPVKSAKPMKKRWSGLTLREIKRQFPMLHGIAVEIAEARKISFGELLDGYLSRLRAPGYGFTVYVGETPTYREAANIARGEFLTLMDSDVETREQACREWLAAAQRELARTHPTGGRWVELSNIVTTVEALLDLAATE